MSNFRYDDDVLLKWVITVAGWCVGSYSHFNSMVLGLWGKHFAGKNKW
jgi:hypothetical protein